MDNQPPLPASAPVTPAGTTYVPPASPAGESPPPTTAPIAPQPISPPPSKNRFLLLVGGLVLLLILVGGGYAYILSMQQPKPIVQKKVMVKPSPTMIPTATPMATDSATASVSADWKTFQSLDGNYSIQYPSDTFVRYICPGEELTLSPRGEEKKETIDMPTCARDGRYSIEVITVTPQTTKPQSDDYYTVTKKDVTIAGIPSQRYTTLLTKESPGPSIDFSEDVYVPYKNKVYQLHVGSKDLLSTFDQMLTTFKFTK